MELAQPPNQVERVESGLLSYGTDTLPDIDSFEVGLDNLIELYRNDNIIGKEALLLKARQGPERKLVGFALDGAPVSPNEQPWPLRVEDGPAGTVRVACYSLRRSENKSFALIDRLDIALGTPFEVDGEDSTYMGKVVRLPLVPAGTPIPEAN